MTWWHLEFDFPPVGASGDQWAAEPQPPPSGEQPVRTVVLHFWQGGISRVGGETELPVSPYGNKGVRVREPL